jgi:tetratricopeptide (TPR) repeat protein
MEAYERVLAVNPRFAPAANNLAYLLIENSGDKERALQLAHTAKEVAPEDPNISDTLGWILHQRQRLQGVPPAEVAQRRRVRVYRHGLPNVTGGFERIFAADSGILGRLYYYDSTRVNLGLSSTTSTSSGT